MKRVLSGIRSNNDLTLGNYLGALKPWVQMQPEFGSGDSQTENLFFIPDLHALVARPDPAELKQNTLSNVAWFVAAGLDPSIVILFAQSQVPAHSELAWILSNFVTMGELSRMTQFKDKSRQGGQEGQLVGMFTYPALMAADILLYDADEVPVGEDQVQHVELARDIAQRFNNLYGESFKLPKAVKPLAGARVMNLQDPTRKMSKSDQDASGVIMLNDSPEEMKKKIMRAVTDSGSEIVASRDKPAVTNLIDIFSSITDRSTEDIQSSYKGKGYGEFKQDLADAIIQHLEPVGQRHQELISDHQQLYSILEMGREKAATIADAKLDSIKQQLGLI